MNILNKSARKRKRMSLGREREFHEARYSEDDCDEATALIAEVAQRLAQLARRHQLEMLDYLLRMTHLEAEERLRLRNRRKLS
jgi:predicted secreted Zn-dependent protease